MRNLCQLPPLGQFVANPARGEVLACQQRRMLIQFDDRDFPEEVESDTLTLNDAGLRRSIRVEVLPRS